MADNPLETMLNDAHDAINQAVVSLLRVQLPPHNQAFVAVGPEVRDDKGKLWHHAGHHKQADTQAKTLAELLNRAFRLGRASIVAETTQ